MSAPYRCLHVILSADVYKIRVIEALLRVLSVSDMCVLLSQVVAVADRVGAGIYFNTRVPWREQAPCLPPLPVKLHVQLTVEGTDLTI